MPYTSAEEAVQHSDYYTKFRELERERIRKQKKRIRNTIGQN